MSAVRVQVLVPASQVPTVEQSPPSFALRLILDVVTVPLGGLDSCVIPSKSAMPFPVAVFPVNVATVAAPST